MAHDIHLLERLGLELRTWPLGSRERFWSSRTAPVCVAIPSTLCPHARMREAVGGNILAYVDIPARIERQCSPWRSYLNAQLGVRIMCMKTKGISQPLLLHPLIF